MKRLLIAIFLFATASLRASTAPVVLNVAFTSGDPVLHIGSSMTVYMAAVVPTRTLGISVTSSLVGQITLSGNDLGSVLSGTPIYFTDGIRAWTVNANGTTSLTLSNASLIGSGTAFMTVADYTALVNNNFTAYTGTLVKSSSPGLSSNYSVNIGNFDQVVLNDSGSAGDDIGGDGLWSGTYYVKATGFMVTAGRLYGVVTVNGLLATNDQPTYFQSNGTYNLDGVRPAIDHFQWSTNDSNYADMVYLSSLSQGTSTPQPTNGWGRFDVTTNKPGVSVYIHINSPVAKDLPPIVIPSGALTPTGFRSWKGDDGSGVYLPDGVYLADLFVSDNYGVPALQTKTTQVTIISMRMQISDIFVSPSVLKVDSTGQSSQDVNVSYKVALSNESNTDISSSLALLGYGTGPYSQETPSALLTSQGLGPVESSVVSHSTVRMLDNQGAVAFAFNTGDYYGGSDTDVDAFYWFNKLAALFVYPNCYEGLPSGIAPGPTAVDVADGDLTNDEDDILGIKSVHGTPNYFYQPFGAMNPTVLSTTKGFKLNLSTSNSGSWRFDITEAMANLRTVVISPAPTSPDLPDPCNPAIPDPAFRAEKVHFTAANNKLRALDSSVVISAQKDPVNTLDSTPPVLQASAPQALASVAPYVYGPSNAGLKPITVQVLDPETDISAANSSITLLDPTGAKVAGSSATNGGSASDTAIITFDPTSALRIGGTYKIMVTACNGGSLCLVKEIDFSIQDQASPDVYSIDLTSANQSGLLHLSSPQSSPDGPFDTITDLEVTLSMPSTSSNTIDWDNSVAALQMITSGAPVDVPMTRTSPLAKQVPLDGKLHYKLNSPIITAGKYQVVVTTYGKDASGNSYSGPIGFVPPKFITVVNPLALNINYPDGTLAVTGLQPVTLTAGATVVSVTNSNPAVGKPSYVLLPANTGFAALQSTGAYSGLQFVVNGVAQTQNLTFDYPSSSPLRASLYFNDSDLPMGVAATDLRVFGLDNGAWAQLSSADYVGTFTNVTRNSFVILLPNGSPANPVYGIFYPSSVTGTTGTVVVSHSSRSFNPNAPNPLARVARFYYGLSPASTMDARVYDTAGRLIKSMSVGRGVIPTLADLTTGQYYFTWDGTNDGGTLVRNGVFLVRWQVTRADGSSDTQTKAVALIK